MTSPLYAAGSNWSSEVNKLRKMGMPLSRSGVQARSEAMNIATSVANRTLIASLNRQKLANRRLGSNLQIALPKIREPMGSLADKGVPTNVEDQEELISIRRWCSTPDAPVWMGDYTFKPIGEIEPGEQVIGWETYSHMARSGRRRLVKTTVLAVNRRKAPEVVRITFASGRTVKCTPDHHWLRYYPPGPDGRILNGPEKSLVKRYDSDYAPLQVGSIARSVIVPTTPLTTRDEQRAADYLAGILDGEGCWNRRTLRICQSPKVNPGVVERIDWCFATLGIDHKRYVRIRNGANHYGDELVIWEMSRGGMQTGKGRKNRQQLVDFYNHSRPVKMDIERMDNALLSANFGEPDTVVSIESLGPGEVVSMQTTTGNYTAWGIASRNCRLFYTTHDLIPLLIDIYSKFPVVGLEFDCLAAETPVITSEGVFPISELAGGIHRVLTKQGKWVDAPFKGFGVKPLMKVTMRRNGRRREFFATPNHGWFVERKRYEKSVRQDRILTENLVTGMKLAPAYGRNVVWDVNPSPFGIAHGFTYGDGTCRTSGGGCSVDMYGDKDAHMLRYFAGCTVYRDLRANRYQGEWVRVSDLPRYFKDRPSLTESTSYLYGWLAGYFAADGTVSKKGEVFLDSARQADIDHARAVCQVLGIKTSDPYVIQTRNGFTGEPWTTYRLRLSGESLTADFFCIPIHQERWEQFKHRKTQEYWTVVSVESTDRVEETYCAVVPNTEAFALDGNILTSNSKDPLIKRFYEDMFLGDDLNYLEFLPDQFGREYFMVGEVTSLAHFSESLGIWSSEEILNPDQLRVTRRLFVQRDRVQLTVKDMVENLRQGPMSQGGTMSNTEETPSERLQRNEEYKELAKNYPELIQAAAQNDGLDISDALLGRVVNKTTPWATRGTPHLLRSFRTLMSEESLNAAQDAVADRLYSPMILATLGVPDLGDGEPWIPDQSELDDLRDDMQNAFAADFRFIAHNFGLKIESVFGRESVPNLDNDFQRIDAKLLQAWGIGEALISGGTGGAYASSALNREFVTQMMVGFQNALRRFILKRAEVVAEAQGHFDYDLKGGVRVPIFREIEIVDEETGETYLKKVPKLLLPEVKFSTLNLRDEAQERAFIAQLKAMGVPVSDKTLAVNIDIEFEQELERQADESVAKLMATAQAMGKVQKLCDMQNLPYPPELAQHLMSTLQLRQGKDQTEMLDVQSEVAEVQGEMQLEQLEMQKTMMEQQMAGGMPMLPPGQGTPAQGEAAPGESPPVGGPGAQGPQGAGPGGGPPQGGPPQGGMEPAVGPGAPGPGAPGPGSPSAGFYAKKQAALNINAPQGTGPVGTPPSGGSGPALPPGIPPPTEVPRNQFKQRPAESDTMRKNTPGQTQATAAKRRRRTRRGEDVLEPGPRRLSKFETGPSSYHASHNMTNEQVAEQVGRREAVWKFRPRRKPKVSDLVTSPEFYRALNMGAYQGQLQADWPEILAGGAKDSRQVLDDMLEQYFELYGVEPQW
jgi:hypothetical protein